MDKLLHVQVAEALGWTEVQGKDHIGWYGRPPERQYGLDGHGISPLPHFDTDWSATGPLIEKYEISVGPGATEAGPWAAISGVFVDGGGWDGLDFDYRGKGPTPLIAVCHLILAIKGAGKL